MSNGNQASIGRRDDPPPPREEPPPLSDGYERKKGYKIEGVPKAVLMMPDKEGPFDLNRWLEAAESKKRSGKISMIESRCLFEVRKRYPASPVAGVRATYHATLLLPVGPQFAKAVLGAIDLAFDQPSHSSEEPHGHDGHDG